MTMRKIGIKLTHLSRLLYACLTEEARSLMGEEIENYHTQHN